MKIFALVLCLCIYDSNAVKLPKTFKRCQVSEELDNKPNDCLKIAIQDAIIQLSDKGNSELGIADLDPLKINKIVIERGESSPLAIKLKFTDNDMIGLRNIVIKSVTGKLSSPKDFKIIVEGYADELILKGPYSVNGRVLILPIQGVGQSTMKMDNITVKITVKGQSQIKNEKEYLKITSCKMENIYTSRLHMNLSNLFNGDKLLGNNMNKFLSENWQDVYTELKPSIEDAFGAIIEAYAKNVLERIQFKNIFLLE